MGDLNTRFASGTYQGLTGSYTSFAGLEIRNNQKKGYIGFAGLLASDNFDKPYGMVDAKAKLAYDSDNIFEQNMRIRTAFDDELKSTQIRYSPLTINLPINDNLSVYSNTHYSGKYNFKEDKWTHSIGNFTGVDYKINEKNCISIELQRKNLQNLKDNSSSNWDINIFYTYKF